MPTREDDRFKREPDLLPRNPLRFGAIRSRDEPDAFQVPVDGPQSAVPGRDDGARQQQPSQDADAGFVTPNAGEGATRTPERGSGLPQGPSASQGNSQGNVNANLEGPQQNVSFRSVQQPQELSAEDEKEIRKLL